MKESDFMKDIPAICDNCSTLFPSGFVIENALNVGLNNIKSSPCPNCGGVGTVPNGAYSEFNNFLSVIKIDEGKDIDKLFKILNDLKEKPETSLSNIETELKSETPQYSNVIQVLADIIMKYNITPAVAISFLLTLFSVCYPVYQDMKDDTEEKIDELIKEQKITNQYLAEISKNQNITSIPQQKPQVKEKQRHTKKKKVYKKRKPKTNYKKK